MPTDFTLPELGENITSGDVLRVLVKSGDTIAKDQPVLELETDKATIEVPSSVVGRVAEVKVKAGDKVKVGQAVFSVESAPAESGTAASGKAAAKQPAAAPAGAGGAPERAPAKAAGVTATAGAGDDGGLEQNVEGVKRQTGPDKPGVKAPTADEAAAGNGDAGDSSGAAARDRKVVDISRGTRAPAETTAAPVPAAAPAAPSVRRMARELGVDVSEVPGSGADGRISIDDVKAHAKDLVIGTGRGGGAAAAVPLPDFSRWGEIERQPMRAVRRKTAEHLSAAWSTIPHVTQHDSADVTALEELRKRYAKAAEAAGGNLTITAIAVKVVAAALKLFPQLNSSIDLAASEIIYKKYVNIGVAVDTDRGLLVPVVRNADTKNLIQLSVEISQLSEKARTRKISLEEMQGGCFSISNLGGIGGTYFTPIVNAPEVAILGISRARMEPVWRPGEARGAGAAAPGSHQHEEDGVFVPRLMLPLSLSYDHRVVDGADGMRFLRWVVEALEQPFLLSLQS
jgi:pyruvate dehydrogenase E2 component (dihydrolipoamide acetyltransferase)